MMNPRVRILVRGIGDIGSAVAHRLFTAGFAVLIHDSSQPAVTRRGMAFSDAVFDGRALLEGISATRADVLTAAQDVLAVHQVIAVCVLDFDLLLRTIAPQVLVDARMRKRAQPGVQRGLAPLTVGLGPNFVAGETVDVAVETYWGEELGNVLQHGPTRPLEGEPRVIAGYGRERYVYAPQSGLFTTSLRIGGCVQAGQTVAFIGAQVLRAPISGALRGLVRDSVPVTRGTKVIEVDPRGSKAVVYGIGERPARIAQGV